MNDIKLQTFFIFDPNLIPLKKKPTDEEMQESKIIFYYPVNEEIHQQRSNTGIIEGTFSFLNIFSNQEKENYLLVELSDSIIISKEYESNKFFCLILENTPFLNNSIDKRNICENLLENLYKTLIIYHGNITEFFYSNKLEDDDSYITGNFSFNSKDKKGRKIELISIDEKTRKKMILSDFIENYFISLNGSKIPFMAKINYFSLNENTYSQIIYSNRRFKEKYEDLCFTSIFYQGYLLHNEIPLEVISIIYNHYYNNLDTKPKFTTFTHPPHFIAQLSNNGYKIDKSSKNNVSNFRKGYDGVDNYYITGISQINTISYQIFIPKLFLYSINKIVKLIIYNRNGLMYFCFFNEKTKLNIQKIIDIEKWTKKYFDNEIPFLKNLLTYKSKLVDNYRFFYFNNSNNSLKLSSAFYDKFRSFINDKFRFIEHNINNNLSSNCIFQLTKYKDCFIYFTSVLSRKFFMMIPTEGNNFKENKEKYDTLVLSLFDQLFFIYN